MYYNMHIHVLQLYVICIVYTFSMWGVRITGGQFDFRGAIVYE